jgi:uncharacterized membrane protein
MAEIPWILVSVGIVVVILAVFSIVVTLLNKKRERKPDYFMFFIMGIIWLGAGIPLYITSNNFFFPIMGIIFMIIGLVHKKKWKANHRTFKQMSPEERKLHVISMIVLGVLLLIGVVAYLMVGRG